MEFPVVFEFDADDPREVDSEEADVRDGSSGGELAVTIGGRIVFKVVVVTLEVDADVDVELELELEVVVEASSVAVGIIPAPSSEYGTVTKVVDKNVVVTETVYTFAPGGGEAIVAEFPTRVFLPSHSDPIAGQTPFQISSKRSNSSLQPS